MKPKTWRLIAFVVLAGWMLQNIFQAGVSFGFYTLFCVGLNFVIMLVLLALPEAES